MRVCVFGSSSSATLPIYLEAAHALGEEIAKRHYVCVNGGGANGVMGSLNEGCTKAGGHIIGVIHEMFVVDKQEDSRIKHLIVCKGSDLKERKQQLLDNADCLIVMPGGVGTFDELWDAVCTKSLGLGGLTHKPISVVNVNGFYDGSILQLQRAAQDCLLHRSVDTYFQVHSSPAEALNWCAEQVQSLSGTIDVSIKPILRTPSLPNEEQDIDLAKSSYHRPTEEKSAKFKVQDQAHSSVLGSTTGESNFKLFFGLTVGIVCGLIISNRKI